MPNVAHVSFALAMGVFTLTYVLLAFALAMCTLAVTMLMLTMAMYMLRRILPTRAPWLGLRLVWPCLRWTSPRVR